MKKLLLRSFVARNEFFHIGVTTFSAGRRDVSLHTHDFSEVFFVTAGRGAHLINGRRAPLERGDLCMIRAVDAHAFRAVDAEGFTLVNVAFAGQAVGYVQRRYCPRPAERPWVAGPMPRVRRLAPEELSALDAWVQELAMVKQSRLELERFLMNLCALMRPRGRAPAPFANLPDWLADAASRFASPEHMPGGPAELARLAGRCPEHVNRTARRCVGRTATELVNEVRLLHAARQLRMTSRPILDIVGDCGLENLAYFYRLFNRRFGATPRRFRLRGEAVVR